MGFSKKIKYYLVHSLQYTNKQAQALIDNGEVEIDGVCADNQSVPDPLSEIKVKDEVVRKKQTYVYLSFYKPRGFQSSLNVNVDNNLSEFFKDYNDLAIAGRLDKDSEGLLLLSNDGLWVEKLCNPKFEKEKEYLVQLNKVPDPGFLKTFESGVDIGNHVTLPCSCKWEGDRKIRVILKEGKNRQIRRMCKMLGYGVESLQRNRVGHCEMKTLGKGKIKAISKNEI